MPWQVQAFDQLEESDLQRMMAFLRRFMAPEADPAWSIESFRWKLGESNPAGRGFLTCAMVNDEVIGVTSVTSKRLWFRRQVIRGAEIGDTFTHPAFLRKGNRRERILSPHISPEEQRAAYVRHSVFGRLVSETRMRALKAGVRLVYGTPNMSSLRGYEKRLQFLSHPTHRNHTFVRPTVRGLSKRYAIGQMLAWPLRGGEWFFDRLTACRLACDVRGRYTVERFEHASSEFDELWDRVREQREFALVRDRAYVHHRFFASPIAAYRVYGARVDGQLCGMMVSRIVTRPGGKRYCYIADWVIDERQPHLFAWLVTHTLLDHDRTDIDAYHLWCGPQRQRHTVLRWLGFVPTSSSPVIFFQNDDGNAVMQECPVLDFTLASSDNV